MSIQSDIRAVANEKFDEESRSISIAIALGLFLGVRAANTTELVKGISSDKSFLDSHFVNTGNVISSINELVLFDVREAQNITREVFNLIFKLKSEPVVITKGTSLSESLFGSFGLARYNEVFMANQEGILEIINLLSNARL